MLCCAVLQAGALTEAATQVFLGSSGELPLPEELRSELEARGLRSYPPADSSSAACPPATKR